jgi:hypothetical protein
MSELLFQVRDVVVPADDPGPALNYELPRPEVFESNAEWMWREYDCAQAAWDGMDDVSDWAVSHPLINTRAESQALASSSVREGTYVGERT